ICSTCPANLLEVAREDAATKLIYSVRGACVIAVALAAIALLAGRWRRASRPQRQAVLPVVAAGLLAAAVRTAWFLADLMGAASTAALGRAAWYAAAVIPVAVLVVFIRRRLAQGAVAGLVVELGGPGAADLRGALARALGDPSLALAYWFAAESRYVDSGGRPVELPQADTGRRATVIERDGRPVAALIHDPALQYNSTLVEAVCPGAAIQPPAGGVGRRGGRADAGQRAARRRAARPAGGAAGIAGAAGHGDRRGTAPDRARPARRRAAAARCAEDLARPRAPAAGRLTRGGRAAGADRAAGRRRAGGAAGTRPRDL